MSARSPAEPEIRRPKVEGRRPKEGRNPKVEARTALGSRVKSEGRIALGLGFRTWDFGSRPSFGPRTSGFGLQSYLTPLPSPRADLKSVRAIPNPRPEDRRPKSELIATPAEQQPIELGHARSSELPPITQMGAARRSRKSEIRSSKSETNPNCQEWGNGQTGNRDVSSPAASNLGYCSAEKRYWGRFPSPRSSRLCG